MKTGIALLVAGALVLAAAASLNYYGCSNILKSCAIVLKKPF